MVSYCSTILVRKIKPQGNYLFAVMAVSCCVCTALNTKIGHWTCLMLRKIYFKTHSFLKMKTKGVLLHSWTVPACGLKPRCKWKSSAYTARQWGTASITTLPSTRGSILAVPNWIILYFQTLSHTGQALSGLLFSAVESFGNSSIPIL